MKPGCRGSRAPRALQQKGPGYLGSCHSGNGLFHSTNARIRTSAPLFPSPESRLRPDRQGHFGFFRSLGVQLVVAIFIMLLLQLNNIINTFELLCDQGSALFKKHYLFEHFGFNTGSCILIRCCTDVVISFFF